MGDNRRLGKLLRIHFCQVAIYRLRTPEGAGGNGGDPRSLVTIVDVRDIGDMGYVRDVDVANIRDINLPQVSVAVMIPGKKRLAWPQRKPGNVTKTNAYREARATDKRNECRAVHRRNGDWPGYPSPAGAN
jgi:hypothetical protein